MIILICGLPGTGKSSLGKEICERTGAVLIRTDGIRKRIRDKPSYSEDDKNSVYSVFFTVAEYVLKSGKDVILDGTFYRAEYRKMAVDLAESTGNEIRMIECLNNEKRIKKHIKSRKDLSDADFAVHLKVRDMWEPIEEEHLKVRMEDFFDDKENTMEKIIGYISS